MCQYCSCVGCNVGSKILSLATNLHCIFLALIGPPLNVRTASRSTSSLTFAWDPPLKFQQNDVITSYTACVSYSENGPCFKTYTTHITTEREWLVRNLNSSTKYYVRVLASIKSGSGFYSQSKGFFTNSSKYKTT